VSQKLRHHVRADSGGCRVVRVIVVTTSAERWSRSRTRRYVAVDVQSMAAATEVRKPTRTTRTIRPRSGFIREYTKPRCAFGAAPVIDDLVASTPTCRFQRRAAPGDSFECSIRHDDAARATSMCCSQALTSAARPRVLPLSVAGDGVVDYTTRPAERKKFLVRSRSVRIMRSASVSAASRSSVFQDAHRRRLGGALWHADFASGNWTTRKPAWKRLRQYIKVKHSNGYETAYGHMSASRRHPSPASACARAR